MTDLRKAAEMALPLLVAYQDYTGDFRIANKCGEAIEALRQALAQPETPDDLLRQSERAGWRYAKELETELAKPEQEPICRSDGRCQYAIDHGAEGLGHCPQGKCCMPQDEQEPVAYLDAVDNKTVFVAPTRKRWLDPHKDKEWKQFHYDHQYDTPLYTAPSKRNVSLINEGKTWQGLTDTDLRQIILAAVGVAEAKLREKNG